MSPSQDGILPESVIENNSHGDFYLYSINFHNLSFSWISIVWGGGGGQEKENFQIYQRAKSQYNFFFYFYSSILMLNLMIL